MKNKLSKHLTKFYSGNFLKLKFFTKKERIRTLRNIVAFYTSTLTINVCISLTGFLFGGFPEVILLFVSFGFMASLALKEVRNKEEYLFYFNNGLSRMRLWMYSAMFNFTVALAFSCAYVFIFKGQ